MHGSGGHMVPDTGDNDLTQACIILTGQPAIQQLFG